MSYKSTIHKAIVMLLFSSSQFNVNLIEFDKSGSVVELIKYEIVFPPQNSGSARQLPVAVQNGC